MLRPSVPILGFPPRVTMTIRGPTKTINETHWYVGDNNLDGAIAESVNLQTKRNALLGNDATIIQCKGSLDNVDGDSKINRAGQGLPSFAGYGNCDPADSDIRVRLEGTPAFRKTLFMGLVPDNVILGDELAAPVVAGYQTALDDYLNYLAGKTPYTAAQWGFLVRNPDRTAYPVLTIRHVSVGVDPTLVVLTVDATAPIVEGDVVQVSRYRDIFGLQNQYNGLFLVSSVSPTTLTLLGAFDPNYAADAVAGTVSRMSRVFQRYTKTTLRGIGGHKRGNRTAQPRGKTKKPRVFAF